MVLRRSTLWLILCAVAPCAASAAVATSPYGMVSTQERLATEVGAKILTRGGNAIDAAVAVGFALAVTYPRAGNLGGGGFMMIHHAASNQTNVIDYRETAPAASYPAMFQNVDGTVDNRRKRHSHKSSGVPGTVKGLEMAWRLYGRLEWHELLAPAITLATDGFPVYLDLHQSLTKDKERLFRDRAVRALFFDGLEPLAVGTLLVQNDLAASLKRIQTAGADGFYQGKTADMLVADMKRRHGLMNHDDLASYAARLREPLSYLFHDYVIKTMPPPSAGGISLIQVLEMTKHIANFDEIIEDEVWFLHTLAEMMRLVFADRNRFAADPDYEAVPVEQLTSSLYNRRLAQSIAVRGVTPSSLIKGGAHLPEESFDTTHYTIMDRDGNVVSNTYTLNFPYGNGKMVPGAGFFLNNEMDDFSGKIGHKNVYGLAGGSKNMAEPGKRPVSSMMPTMVFDASGTAVLATGAPGGSRIVSGVVQLITRVLLRGETALEATRAPKIHHQWLPDQLFVESSVSEEVRQQLSQYGHVIAEHPLVGRLYTVSYDGEVFTGVADARVSSSAAMGPAGKPMQLD